jgi:serine/threonine protein phosphatase PrpC
MDPDSPTQPALRVADILGPAAHLHLDVAARTDVGRQRHKNEDSFLVARTGDRGCTRPCAAPLDVAAPEWVVLGVFDGMGGAPAGEVASRSAAEVIGEVLADGALLASPSELGARLVASVEEAGRRIHTAALGQRDLLGMGTTATVCALSGDALFAAQVGDSRAYLLRGDRLTQITRDQTLIEAMATQGQITAEELANCAFHHIILQALGTSPRVDVDLVRVTVRRGDVLLICSDGLFGLVEAEVIRRVLEDAASPAAAAEALIALANEAGGPDNITAIVARIGGQGLEVSDEAVAPQRGGGLSQAGALFPLVQDRPTLPTGVEERAAPSHVEAPLEPASDRRSALGRVIAFLRGALRPGSGR